MLHSSQAFRNFRRPSTVATLLLLSIFVACKKESAAEPEGYRVVSYDSRSGTWVVIHSGRVGGEFRRNRLLRACDLYKRGEHESQIGPHACDLRVGELLVSKHSPDEQGTYRDFVDIWEMSNDRLSIDRGEGANRVLQHFVILKSEMVQD